MYNLIAIDDDPPVPGRRLENVKKAADELSVRIECYQPDSEEAFAKCKNALSALQFNTCVILDLSFRFGHAPAWRAVKEALNELCGIINGVTLLQESGDRYNLRITTEDGFDTISDNLLDGIALLPSLLQSVTKSKHHKILVVSATSQGGLSGLRKLFVSLNAYAKQNNLNVTFQPDEDGRDLGELSRAKGIVRDTGKAWQMAFPDFHEDPWVDKLVSQWLGGYRAYASRNIGDQFCNHDDIQNALTYYASLLHEMFALKPGCLDSKDIKAFLQLRVPPSPLTPSPNYFLATNPTLPVPGWNDLSVDSLLNIMPVLNGNGGNTARNVKLEVEPRRIRLPACPGFIFLAALRLLCRQLRMQDYKDSSGKVRIGIIDFDKAFEIKGSEGGPFCLRIPLIEAGIDYQYALGRKWVEKCSDGRTFLQGTGVCTALWDLLVGRVRVSNGSLADTSELALLRALDGPGYPILGVSFAAHYINFHWH